MRFRMRMWAIGAMSLGLLLTIFEGCAPAVRPASAPADASSRRSTAGPRVRRLPAFPAPELSDTHGTVASRGVWVYLPASYLSHGARRYPVLYLFDGQNLFDDATSYISEWGVDEALDSLGLDCIVVGLDNGGARRAYEYTPLRHPSPEGRDYRGRQTGGGHLSYRWLLQRIKPWVDSTYRTSGTQYVGGASLGGLMALYGQLTHPETFSAALVLSGAYIPAPGIYDYAAQHARPGQRYYHLAGYREWDRDAWGMVVRHMHQVADSLRRRGVTDQVMVTDSLGEHNETLWRRAFPAAAQWLMRAPAPSSSLSSPPPHAPPAAATRPVGHSGPGLHPH